MLHNVQIVRKAENFFGFGRTKLPLQHFKELIDRISKEDCLSNMLTCHKHVRFLQPQWLRVWMKSTFDESACKILKCPECILH